MSYHRLKLGADKMKNSCPWCTFCVIGASMTPWRCLDCHKYEELGSNEIFSGIESWEPSAVPSFHSIRLDFDNSKCISTHCTWTKMFLIIYCYKLHFMCRIMGA